eukprot:CAMPEP_0182463016 /NCGR_PEP_ID=MMETSP1319-20130603/7088_1 /TAXON_ID=172717 /ORGANISM="Bolidomonas pacifica, Strain RCC208" /LENGTH=141 /DNA_ID=CAMNT_0024662513 /DNA_START=56 /DNA_END=478 /DNA_ORIENTATION=-
MSPGNLGTLLFPELNSDLPPPGAGAGVSAVRASSRSSFSSEYTEDRDKFFFSIETPPPSAVKTESSLLADELPPTAFSTSSDPSTSQSFSTKSKRSSVLLSQHFFAFLNSSLPSPPSQAFPAPSFLKDARLPSSPLAPSPA